MKEKRKRPKINFICSSAYDVIIGQNGPVPSHSLRPASPQQYFLVPHSWSNTVSIKRNIILLLKTINNKAKSRNWERQCDRLNGEEKSETNNEKRKKKPLLGWNEILSNFAFYFSIVHVIILLCLSVCALCCVLFVYKSFASIPFNDWIPTSRLSFSFIRFSNSANCTCPKISAEWKSCVADMNTTTVRSIILPEEVCASARTLNTTDGVGWAHERWDNFRAKTASEFSTVIPNRNLFQQVGCVWVKRLMNRSHHITVRSLLMFSSLSHSCSAYATHPLPISRRCIVCSLFSIICFDFDRESPGKTVCSQMRFVCAFLYKIHIKDLKTVWHR